MKKLKIFLMLSLLLCFGFVLSSEVHAQGDGPKIFEVGDVLPATTQLRISFPTLTSSSRLDNFDNNIIYSNFAIVEKREGLFFDLYINNVLIAEGNYKDATFTFKSPYDVNKYIDIDTSSWDVTKRTITSTGLGSFGSMPFYWEDLNPTPISSKVFEVGDILPAGYIKISWDFTGKPIVDGKDFVISSDGDLFIEILEFIEYERYNIDINYDTFYADTPGYTIITLTSPTEITDVYAYDDDYYEYIGDSLLWEVLPPEYSNGYDNLYEGELLEIEEDYILPESIIGINLVFNNTGGPKSGTVVYTFGDYGQIVFTAQEDNTGTSVALAEIDVQVTPEPRGWDIYWIDDTLAYQSFGSTRGFLSTGILLDFSWATEEERTITDITIEGDLELDIIFTRILTEEELTYQEGYTDGYTTAREIFGWKDGGDWYNGVDAWNLGEKYARELYGFYDSTTDEWLSVSDYVARYGTGGGTGPLGPSDFYNNFDKYFIPAMIIVFGGAIVLTILKVFKGRE